VDYLLFVLLSDFISLDCGSPEGTSYDDGTTGINYISDSSLIKSGTTNSIASSYNSNSVIQQFRNLRAFPRGTRNCYTLRPREGKGNKYLIRASFFYGNYDSRTQPPTFDIQLGVDKWITINFTTTATPTTVEIIHIPPKDHINFCLVKTGISNPFISSLELRSLNNTNTMYTTVSGSLELFARLNFNTETTQSIR
jgi:hypothetical protein